MNKMSTGLGVLAVVAFAGSAMAGTILQESFEGLPGTGYTMSNQFDDGFFDFFDRYAVPDLSNAARDDFLTGWDGSFGIMGQDHDGDGFAPTQTVAIAGVNIAGMTSISMDIAVGALSSEPQFNNYEAVDGDGISIYATIDAGARTLIGNFAPNFTGRSDLYLDTDLDGIGDGVNLSAALADFSFAIGGTGSLLTIEVDMTTTSSFEPLAIDNIRINAIPAPGALALLGLGGLVATRRRR